MTLVPIGSVALAIVRKAEAAHARSRNLDARLLARERTFRPATACAWCGTELRAGWKDALGSTPNHGICSRCKRAFAN